ncbi:hypothetical protein ACIBAC_40880 [Streptomyces sp. NPDC051362]|uniref:hypothetical protein n=1 Tax=Streptomyces sp. NPDC051362 TaxID=3365651 RepID=UPI0037AA6A14
MEQNNLAALADEAIFGGIGGQPHFALMDGIELDGTVEGALLELPGEGNLTLDADELVGADDRGLLLAGCRSDPAQEVRCASG